MKILDDTRDELRDARGQVSHFKKRCEGLQRMLDDQKKSLAQRSKIMQDLARRWVGAEKR